MKKTTTLSILLALHSSLQLSAQVFDETFETQTIGDAPSGTAVVPASGNATTFATIIGDAANNAGTGNALQLFDNSSSSAFAYEQNMVGSSANHLSTLHISYDLSWNQDFSVAGDYARFGVGEYDASTSAKLNSSANIFMEIRWGSDGVFRVVGATGNSSTSLTTGTSANINIFINDNDSQIINYVAPSGSTVALSANSFAVYVDQSLIRADTLYRLIASSKETLSGDNNLGRIGVDSFSSHEGIDYTIDNYSASAIPEPSSYATCLALATLGIALGQRRKQSAT